MTLSIVVIYALQASLALALLYSLFWLFLGKTGFHTLNRFVLTGIGIASLALPFLAREIPDLTPSANIVANGHAKYTSPASLLTATQGLFQAHATSNTPQSFTITPATLVAALYLGGVAIFLTRIITPIFALITLIRRSPTHRTTGFTLVQLRQPSPPFSFFRYIFLHKEDYSEVQQENILRHEQVHIRQYHTLDILFMELYTVIFWFHPLAWRLNSQVKLNLEYLADRHLIQSDINPKEYQYQLLQLATGRSLSRMANYFNQSHLKKRIAMMNSTTRRTAIWKYLLLLPVLTALCLVFATGNAQAPAKPGNSDIYLVIRHDLSKSVIHKIETQLAAEGINFSLTSLTYTDRHELSGFHLIITQNGRTLEDLSLDGTGQPINEPFVFYWLRSRNGNPTLTRGYPTDVSKNDLKIMHNLSGLLTKLGQDIELHGSARIGD